jgi:hypothetical protein
MVSLVLVVAGTLLFWVSPSCVRSCMWHELLPSSISLLLPLRAERELSANGRALYTIAGVQTLSNLGTITDQLPGEPRRARRMGADVETAQEERFDTIPAPKRLLLCSHGRVLWFDIESKETEVLLMAL